MHPAQVVAQARRVGMVPLTGPVVAAGLVAVVGWVASRVWPLSLVVVLMMALEQLFVLCAGICAAVAMTGDRLVELHEATPTGFRAVQLVRVSLVAVSGMLGAGLMFWCLHACGIWPRDQGWISMVAPAGATIIVTAIALVSSAFTGAASATTIAVVACWMFLTMMWDPYVAPVWIQRGAPLLACAALSPVVWRRLADSERNVVQAVNA